MKQRSSLADNPLFFQRIVEDAPNGVIAYQPVYDGQGVVTDYQPVYHNTMAVQLLGFSAEEFTNQTLFECFPFSRDLARQFTAQTQDNQPFFYTHFFERTGYWIELQIRRLEDGFFAVLRDVTDRKRYETQMLHQNALLDGMLNTFLTGITAYEAVTDEAGVVLNFRVIFANEGSARLAGASAPEQVIGRTVSELYPQTRQNGLWEKYHQVYHTRQPMRQEHYYPSLDKWIDVSIQPSGNGLLVTYNDISDRKRTELQARQQAEVLLQISQSMQMAISTHEPVRAAGVAGEPGPIVDFRYTYFNEKAQEWLPVDWRQVIGQTVRSMGFAANVEQTIARMKQVVETGAPSSFDAVLPDGRTFYNIVSRSGSGTVSTFIDVTKQRQNEQHIQELKVEAEQQKDLLQSILDASQTSIVRYEAIRSPDGTIIDFRMTLANQATLTMLQQTAGEVLGRTMTELNPLVANSVAFDQYRSVVETGQPQQVERDGPNGHYYYVLVVKFGDGLLLSSIDITENRLYRNQLEAANATMQQQKDLLQSVFDGSQNAIIAFEAIRSPRSDGQPGRIIDFRYVLQNEANRRRVGRSDDILLGSTMLTFFPEVATNGLLEQYAHVVETGEPLRFELEYTYRDEPGWYDYSVVKRSDGIVMTVHDKTIERRARQLVEQANFQLQRSNENLQSFAYVASHDLQEPLRKIQSFGDILSVRFADQLGDGVGYLERMQASAHRMSVLIRDLLTYSRISTQREMKKAVALNDVLTTTLTDLDLLIEEAGAVVTVASLPTLPGDAVQLGQLFQNLLNNALKFRRPTVAPAITVEASLVTAAQLPASVKPAWAAQTYHCITVADNGIGFEEKYLDRIFQVFQRLHGKDSFAGTGIGLAICEKIVANHGGAITATSQPDQGATFLVYLPTKAVSTPHIA